MNRFFILRLLMMLTCAAGAAGCASYPISRQWRTQAQSLPLADVQRDPAAHQGRIVIWGGSILKIVNNPGDTELTILQAPLNREDQPGSVDESSGRFIIRTVNYLDPEVYQRDRKVTVAGAIDGIRAEALGNTTYRYPVLEARQIYLWPPDSYVYYVTGFGGPWDWGWYAPYYGYLIPYYGLRRPYFYIPGPYYRHSFGQEYRDREDIQRGRREFEAQRE